MVQVEDNASFLIFRESIAMNTYTRGGRQLSLNMIVIKHYFIITGYRLLCIVRKARSITVFRMIGGTWIQFQFSCSRHNEDVTQIRMSCTIEMRMTETYNGRIIITISSTIFINLLLIYTIQIMRNGICIRTQLNNPERYTSTRKSVSHSVCTDNRIDIFYLSNNRTYQTHK